MHHARHRVLVVFLLLGLVVSLPVGASGTVRAQDNSGCSFPVSVTDATGTTVTVPSEPTTVVTLGPSAAQTMWEIGGKDDVTGLTAYASYLDGAASRTNVSGNGESFVSVEKVVGLQPDLVLAPNIIDPATVTQLRDSGLTVYKFREAHSLSEVEEKTKRTGRLTGNCEGAGDTVQEMKADIRLIRTAVSGESAPSVLYDMGYGWTAGSETYIHSIIETAGGSNLAANAGIKGYRQISDEVVVARDPSHIFYPSNLGGIGPSSAYQSTTAVQNGNVLEVDTNYVNQPAPRSIRVLRNLTAFLHPEAYADVLDEAVSPKGTVFQGDHVYLSRFPTERLYGVTGPAKGLVLEKHVPEDQPVGVYSAAGNGPDDPNRVTVRHPRIDDYRFLLDATGGDVTGGAVGRGDALVNVTARYNFDAAERVALTVDNERGYDVTDEVVLGSPYLRTGNGTEYVHLDLRNEPPGTYTITLAGAEDLDWGDATVSETLEVTDRTDLTIDGEADRASLSSRYQYAVRGGTPGTARLASIDATDLRNDLSAEERAHVFRNVADTTAVGYVSNASTGRDIAYAVVAFDGTTAHGAIDTSGLRADTTALEVYNTTDPAAVAAGDVEPVDHTEFRVRPGTVSLNRTELSPYVIGSSADLSGTATAARRVDVYVRTDRRWVRLTDANGIAVTANDTFEQSIRVSDRAESTLSVPGRYTIGVVDHADSRGVRTLGVREFASATSHRYPIRAVDGGLRADVTSVNGQVNTVDERVAVHGSAKGSRSVLLLLVDERGTVAGVQFPVATDGTFGDSAVSLPLGSSDFTEGPVQAVLVAVGRDGAVGDGRLPDRSEADLAALQAWAESLDGSGEAVRDRILAQTVGDTASDDSLVNASFRYADASISIASVRPADSNRSNRRIPRGATMVVTGRTNLVPEDHAIQVEVVDGDGRVEMLRSIASWNRTGAWSVSIDTDSLDPGGYTLDVNGAGSADRESIDVLTAEQRDLSKSPSTASATPAPTSAHVTSPGSGTVTTDITRSPTDATPTTTPGLGAGFSGITLLAALVFATWLQRTD